MIKKLLNLFSIVKPVNEYVKIKSTIFNYKNLNNENYIVSPHKDIIEFNKAIAILLEIDLLNEYIDKNKLLPVSNNYTTIKHWLTNNGRMLNNINKELNIWCDNSVILLTKYEQLNKLKKSSTVISFNTRELKRYIINIEETKNILLNKESNDN